MILKTSKKRNRKIEKVFVAKIPLTIKKRRRRRKLMLTSKKARNSNKD
jgi:hypothetical protein